MHQDTGEIKKLSDLTDEEKKSKKWKPVHSALLGTLLALKPDERVKAMRSAPTGCYRASSPDAMPNAKSRAKKRKRKSQKLARRRNRG